MADISPNLVKDIHVHIADALPALRRVYIQLIQLITRKTNNPIKNWGKDLNRHFFKEDVQMANKQTHEMMLSITHYQRNANQNHNEISSNTVQNGHYQKIYKQ